MRRRKRRILPWKHWKEKNQNIKKTRKRKSRISMSEREWKIEERTVLLSEQKNTFEVFMKAVNELELEKEVQASLSQQIEGQKMLVTNNENVYAVSRKKMEDIEIEKVVMLDQITAEHMEVAMCPSKRKLANPTRTDVVREAAGNIMNVTDSVLPIFRQSTEHFVNNGNVPAVDIIAKALAKIAGYTKVKEKIIADISGRFHNFDSST
eukprot:Gb_05743 [translate_table: standard]